MTQPPIVPGEQPERHAWPPVTTHATPPPKRSILPWVTAGGLALVGVLALGGVLFLSGQETAKPASAWEQEQAAAAQPFASAQKKCDAFKEGTEIADGGKTLIIDGRGEESGGLNVTGLDCVLEVLKTPASVRAHIFDTRALDGRQTDTWPGFSASWSYHPDDGMDVVVTAAP